MNFWTIKEINEFFDFLGAPKEWIGRGFVMFAGAFGGMISYFFTQLFIIPRMFDDVETIATKIELISAIFTGIGLIGSYFISIYIWKHWLSKIVTWKI